MPTNLAIDDELLEQALRLGGKSTKRETVNDALREFIARRRRRKALDRFGTIEFAQAYDYKQARKKR